MKSYILLTVLLCVPVSISSCSYTATDFYRISCPNGSTLSINMDNCTTVGDLKNHVAGKVNKEVDSIRLFGSGDNEEEIELIEGDLPNLIFYDDELSRRQGAIIKGTQTTDPNFVASLLVSLKLQYSNAEGIKPVKG